MSGSSRWCGTNYRHSHATVADSSHDHDTQRHSVSQVREMFMGCTVLTIAHRLATIVDYDLVAVLDAGRLVEYGPPAELLRVDASEGYFAALVEDSGTNATHLVAVVRMESHSSVSPRQDCSIIGHLEHLV
eukprot:SAG11_NODE_274_length_11310_cov_4.717510_3_plen_131_part_00